MSGKYRAEFEAKVYKPNGTLMASQSNTWEDMDYGDVVDLEGAFVEMQGILQQLGEKAKKEKKSSEV
jgi:hypothetical protein